MNIQPATLITKRNKFGGRLQTVNYHASCEHKKADWGNGLSTAGLVAIITIAAACASIGVLYS